MVYQDQHSPVVYRKMMEVNGTDVFQVFSTDWITDKLTANGTLYYGPTANKSDMKAWDETESAGGFFLVKNAVPGMYYYISGNTGILKIYYV